MSKTKILGKKISEEEILEKFTNVARKVEGIGENEKPDVESYVYKGTRYYRIHSKHYSFGLSDLGYISDAGFRFLSVFHRNSGLDISTTYIGRSEEVSI